MKRVIFSLFIISVCAVYAFAVNIGNDVYAVYSETYEGVKYDVLNPTTPANLDGGYMGGWGGATLTGDYTVGNSTEVLEGMKVVVSSDNYGGLWTQFGYSTDTPRGDQSDKIATDMSPYDGGTFEFWIKTSTEIHIEIKDNEYSWATEVGRLKCTKRVVLSDINPGLLDGNWHYVSTPIASFTNAWYVGGGAATGIQLSTVKELGNFSVPWVADPSGYPERTFWLDNILWVSSNTQTLDITLKNISDNNTTNQITWSNVENILGSTNPWKAADQYVELNLDYYKENWGIQIYTDNKDDGADPKYTGSGDPAGLIDSTTTSIRMPMCWRIVDVTTDTYNMVEDAGNKIYSSALSSGYHCFLWMKDRGTTGADQFNDGEAAVTVWDNGGIQHAESTWGGAVSRNYIYLGAKFENAVTPRTYKTSMLIIELFYE